MFSGTPACKVVNGGARHTNRQWLECLILNVRTKCDDVQIETRRQAFCRLLFLSCYRLWVFRQIVVFRARRYEERVFADWRLIVCQSGVNYSKKSIKFNCRQINNYFIQMKAIGCDSKQSQGRFQSTVNPSSFSRQHVASSLKFTSERHLIAVWRMKCILQVWIWSGIRQRIFIWSDFHCIICNRSNKLRGSQTWIFHSFCLSPRSIKFLCLPLWKMDCRRWPIPKVKGLSPDRLECIRKFINEQRWLFLDLSIAQQLNVGADWLECFFVYVATYPMDYKHLVNAPHDARAVAHFIWNNCSWIWPILFYFIEKVDPSFAKPQ